MITNLLNNLSNIHNEVMTKLTPENIKSGVNVLNVVGNYSGLNTADANATAINLYNGRTAYVNGKKITGTLPVLVYPIDPIIPNNYNYQFIAGNSAYITSRENVDYMVGTYQIANSNQPDSWMFEGNRKMKLGLPYNIITNLAGLTPNILKNGETILDITGTYEGSGGSSNLKHFNTVAEMNNSSGNNDGDMAVVYDLTPVPVASTFNCSGFIIKEKIPKSIITSGTVYALEEHDQGSILAQSNDTITLTLPDDEFMSFPSRTLFEPKSGDNDYSYRHYYQWGNTPYILNLHDAATSMDDSPYQYKTVKSYTFKDVLVSSEIWNYIIPINIGYYTVYTYNAGKDLWVLAPTSLTAINSDIQSGKTALGLEGLRTGTLSLNGSSEFFTVPCNKYENGAITDTSSLVIKINPTNSINLGDARWAAWSYYAYMDPESGPSLETLFVTFTDANKVITFNSYGEPNVSGTATVLRKDAGASNCLQEMSEATYNRLITYTSAGNNLVTAPYDYEIYGTTVWLATNCEVQAVDGTVLQAAGPKASDVKSGSYYVNIFGEKVNGTYSA